MGNHYLRKNKVRRLHCAEASLLSILVVVLSSCICGGGQPKVTLQYAVDYTAPASSELSRLSAKVGIERFSVARAFKGHDMIYSPKPYQEDAYNYSRWIADPADMITDDLLRDFRAFGLFEAVFSRCDAEKPRYVVQGGVERIMESDRGDSSEAVLAVNIILLDRGDTSCPERIMFQKTYQASEPITKRTAEAMASGISAAASRLSGEIITDVYKAVGEAITRESGTAGSRPANCK